MKTEMIIKTASVWLMNEQGELLLQLRAPDGKNPNVWWTSAGGLVDPNETPLETVKREALEELGLDIPIEEFVFLEDWIVTNDDGITRHPHVFFARGDWKISDMNLQKSEVAAVKYVSIPEIKKIIGTFACPLQPERIECVEKYLE